MSVRALLGQLEAFLEAAAEPTPPSGSTDVLKKAEKDFGKDFVAALNDDPKTSGSVKGFLTLFYAGYEPFKLAKVVGTGPPANGSLPLPVPKGQALPKNRQDAIEFVNAAVLELGNNARAHGLDRNESVSQARAAVNKLNNSAWNA